jgi:hypothetical protein
MFFVTVSKDFKRSGQVKQPVQLQQPSTGKLKLMFTDPAGKYYPIDFDFFNENDEDLEGIVGLRLSRNEDSLLMTNMRIRLQKSNDDSFHVSIIKRARASSAADAELYAEQINFTVEQSDSVLNLPHGFIIDNKNKFRNQQLIFVVEIPVGKEVYIDRKASNFIWVNFRGGARGLSVEFDEDYEDESWRPGVWYKMTENGIERNGDALDLDRPDRPPLPDSPIDPEEKIERLREEIREKERELESADNRINEKDSLAEMQVGANGYNNKISSSQSSSEERDRKGNFQILFRALNLLKLAR